MNDTLRKHLNFFCCIVFFSVFVSCAQRSAQRVPLANQPLMTEAAPSFQPLRVNSVVVMPLFGAPESADTATDQLVAALHAGTTMEIINRTQPKQVAVALAAPTSDRARADSAIMRSRAAALGKATGAQGALYGLVTKFDSRAVGFRLWLIDPQSLETWWSATYELRSEMLTENLLDLGQFLESRGRPLEPFSAMRAGFSRAAAELETKRRSALSAR